MIRCFIPIKQNSKRVLNKNSRKINDKKLYEIVIEKCCSVSTIDEVIVDTDMQEVKDYCSLENIKFIHRKPENSLDSAGGNDLIETWIDLFPDTSIIIQTHVTSPFLKSETLYNMVEIMKSGAYDSCFTVNKEQTWFWYEDKPVNYDLNKLTRSQDAKSLIKETTSTYCIRKDAFNLLNRRIGNKHFKYYVDKVEAIDIDDELDFKMAKAIGELL